MNVAAAGVALFSGETSTVELSRALGPTTLRTASGGGPIASWSHAPAFRTTLLAHPSLAKVACVEHLFAALAAFGAYKGVSIFVRGSELPILDGGSARWCELLAKLDVSSSSPRLEVVREGSVAVGDSTYLFFPGARREVSITVDFADAGAFAASLPAQASWDGTRSDFVERIAGARTFVFARDIDEFIASEAGAHAPAESFVVLGDDAVNRAGSPFVRDEPARHKLLDFMGDLFVAGGPPIGRVEARRPGHARNHEALCRALEVGIVRVL